MTDNPPAGNPAAQRCDDFEYDEAHDSPSGPVRGGAPQQHVMPPEMDFGAGGDYGYDEAHDLRAR